MSTEQWQSSWRAEADKGLRATSVLADLWACLKDLDSPLGRLVGEMRNERVPPRESSSKQRGDDLLPMHTRWVKEELTGEGNEVVAGVSLQVSILNYLWLGGGAAKWPGSSAKAATKAQRKMIFHLAKTVRDLQEVSSPCANPSDVVQKLKQQTLDYGGEPVLLMENLEAEKVIPVWPKEGESAVQDASSFLPSWMKKALERPRDLLLPPEEWPSRPPVSKVRASDEEWTKIVGAAAKRGLMYPVEAEDVFRDGGGRMVLNGAGAVKKEKVVNGVKQTLQRFISNFIPTNSYQRKLEGGDDLLPYLGQLTLLEQGEDQEWLIDSEDFTSCFNLFRLPASWRPFMCFAKPVDAELFGGQKGHLVYPSMGVIPMGWTSAVSVTQMIVRTLVFEESQIPKESEVQKRATIPDTDDLTVIYLDSYDELRRVSSTYGSTLGDSMSERQEPARWQNVLDVRQSPGARRFLPLPSKVWHPSLLIGLSLESSRDHWQERRLPS